VNVGSTSSSEVVQSGSAEKQNQSVTENIVANAKSVTHASSDAGLSQTGSNLKTTSSSSSDAAPAQSQAAPAGKTTNPAHTVETAGTKADAATIVVQQAAASANHENNGVDRHDASQPDGRRNAENTLAGRGVKAGEQDDGRTNAPGARGSAEENSEVVQPAGNQTAAIEDTVATRELVFTVLPLGAAQLLDQLPIDARVVDQALQQFMHQIDNLGEQMSQAPKGFSILGWAVLGAVATTTIQTAKRRLRKKRPGLQATGLSDDSLSWLTDLDASSSGMVV